MAININYGKMSITQQLRTLESNVNNAVQFHNEIAESDIKVNTLIELANENKNNISTNLTNITNQSSQIATIQTDILANTDAIEQFNSGYTEQLENEATTRASQDTVLQNLISTETSNRETAISDEQTARNLAILTESNTRSQADTNLQTNITAEETARIEKDTELETLISTETTNRTIAIATETSARETAINTTVASIASESNTRSQADTNLQTNITAEETARIDKDTELETLISTETTNRTTSINELNIAKEPNLILRTYDTTEIGNFKPFLSKDNGELKINNVYRNHLHLEGEGLHPITNNFGFSTGSGALSAEQWGTFIGTSYLTKFYYSVCRFDSLGNAIQGGTASITFQLYHKALATSCYAIVNLSDMTTESGRNTEGFFRSTNDIDGIELKTLNNDDGIPGNYVTGSWSFKVISMSGDFDDNTRHRLTIQYEIIDINLLESVSASNTTDISESIAQIETNTINIAQNISDIATLQSASGSNWTDDNLFICKNIGNVNMGEINPTEYNALLDTIVKTSTWGSRNSSNGYLSTTTTGWYRVNVHGSFEQRNTEDYNYRASVRLGLYNITDSDFESNFGLADGYLRGNTGTGIDDLNRYVYVVNDGYAYLESGKNYVIRVNVAIGGMDYIQDMNNIWAQSIQIHIEKLG